MAAVLSELPLVHVPALVLHAPLPVPLVLHHLAVVGFPSPVVQGTVALTHALHPLALVLQLHRRPRGSPVLALPVRPPGKHLTLVLAPVLAL
eukprot:CAMPEP_0114276544 /NCGR_PEP_ID=MMETSP0059-20121206/287_1 /TAXON_ID=36894 /ORGANISM="Pyramimonas parkeae, Strain CCMP726" /LENGTH=91 /DNA_ID=CAMNT_0001396537 /DNA_START=757 /DNA_END=1028 /DNA_ORIENTATION=-